MRVLLIGPGVNRKYGDKFYYSTSRRLMNGFIRNGHFVMHVSDRDLSDYALGLRGIGKYYAGFRINQIARHVRPHLIVLLLADLMPPETIAELRRSVPGVKIVAVEIDALARESVAKRFSARLDQCDAGFITTGGELLASVVGSRRGYHIPNLVDPAIDDQLAFETKDVRYDVFFAGSQRNEGLQWSRALALKEASPQRSYCYAGAAKTGGLWGYDFIEAQGRSRIGLNLNGYEGHLYASDRMGQFLGNGMLLATDRASGYDRFFDADEMIFFSSVEELDQAISRVLAERDAWRMMAQKGRAKSLAIMSNQIVCRFIEDMTLHDRPCSGWQF